MNRESRQVSYIELHYILLMQIGETELHIWFLSSEIWFNVYNFSWITSLFWNAVAAKRRGVPKYPKAAADNVVILKKRLKNFIGLQDSQMQT